MYGRAHGNNLYMSPNIVLELVYTTLLYGVALVPLGYAQRARSVGWTRPGWP
jgi:hypothetical protein